MLSLCKILRRIRDQVYSSTHFLRNEMEVSCQLHTPIALHPGNEPRYPLNRRPSENQRQYGRFGENKKNAHICRDQKPGPSTS